MVWFFEQPITISTKVKVRGYNPSLVKIILRGYHGKFPPSEPEELDILVVKEYDVDFSKAPGRSVTITEDALYRVEEYDVWYLEVWTEVMDKVTGVTKKERTGVFSFYLGGLPPFISYGFLELSKDMFIGSAPIGGLQKLTVSKDVFIGSAPRISAVELNVSKDTVKGERPVGSTATLSIS